MFITKGTGDYFVLHHKRSFRILNFETNYKLKILLVSGQSCFENLN